MKKDEIKKYWDKMEVESMYDKNLLEIEIEAVLEQIDDEDSVIDIGCGEGEGTARYFEKAKSLLAVDFSSTRLEKLKNKCGAIETVKMDMRGIAHETLNRKFSKVVTQRSLINLKNFDEQKSVIKGIHSLLEDNGKYIMLEGFIDGVDAVNMIRNDFNLPSIPVKWHNHFFVKAELMDFMSKYYELEYSRDFSLYFFITRTFNAIREYPDIPQWNDDVNLLAKEMELKFKNQFIKGVSRLELLVFKKKQ